MERPQWAHTQQQRLECGIVRVASIAVPLLPVSDRNSALSILANHTSLMHHPTIMLTTPWISSPATTTNTTNSVTLEQSSSWAAFVEGTHLVCDQVLRRTPCFFGICSSPWVHARTGRGLAPGSTTSCGCGFVLEFCFVFTRTASMLLLHRVPCRPSLQYIFHQPCHVGMGAWAGLPVRHVPGLWRSTPLSAPHCLGSFPCLSPQRSGSLVFLKCGTAEAVYSMHAHQHAIIMNGHRPRSGGGQHPPEPFQFLVVICVPLTASKLLLHRGLVGLATSTCPISTCHAGMGAWADH